METTMTRNELNTPRKSTTTTTEAPLSDEEDVSILSTSCSSLEADDASLGVSQRPTRKTLWKDKNGKARYVAGDIPLKPDQSNQNKQRGAVAAAAVTAGVATGAVVGLVVLGPVGLAVGGLASAGSAASALATRKQWGPTFRNLSQQSLFKAHQQTNQQGTAETKSVEPTMSVQEPPCRRFSSVHDKEQEQQMRAAAAASVSTEC